MSRILIVDDILVNLELLEARLEGAGFETFSAQNGVEALEILDNNSVDMIISDILMPQMDGYQLCRECKKNSRLKSIPFIFYTATYTDEKDKAFAMSLGAEGFVIKPAEKGHFMEVVEGFLNQYKAGTIRPSEAVQIENEETYYRDYNERLVAKLEKKVLELEIANRATLTEHERVEEEIRSNLARMESLLNISQYEAESIQDLLNFALNEAIRLTKSKIGFIYLFDEKKQELRLGSWSKEVMKECSIRDFQDVRQLKDAGLWAEAARQASPFMFNDFQADHPMKQGYPEGHAHLEKFVSIPVLMQNCIVAVVGVANKERDYDDTDVRDLQLLMDGVWRIKVQREAENERFRLISAVEQAHEGIAILDSGGKIQYANSAMRAQLETKEGGILNEDLLLEAACTIDNSHDDIKAIVERGELFSGRIQHRRQNGTILDCETTFTPIQDKGGRLINFVVISRDISDELIMAERLRQSQKMEAIGTLAGGIAHDFNNILMGITGFAELARMEDDESEAAQHYLDHLLTACDRAKELVSQILTFSRKSEQEKKPVHLIPLIGETCRFLRASLPVSIQIKKQFNTEADLIMADPTQIQQVIMNLCTNAGHAMQEGGGVLEISTNYVNYPQLHSVQSSNLPSCRCIQLSVRDTGSGIPPGNLERVFDPYFTTKEKGEGTGLGLAVVHGIVNDHGGSIKVFSKEGKGTTFHVLFPVKEKETTTKISSKKATLPVGRETILFVDDEENIRQVAAAILRRLGYAVITAASGKEALELMSKEPDKYDLVFTDKTMHQMSGFELNREIRKIRAEIPVLLCTGFLETNEYQKAISEGFRNVVEKPLKSAELATIVRKALDSSRQEESTNASLK